MLVTFLPFLTSYCLYWHLFVIFPPWACYGSEKSTSQALY